MKKLGVLKRELAALTRKLEELNAEIAAEEQALYGESDAHVNELCPDLHPDTLRALAQQVPDLMPEADLMKAAVRFRIFASEASYTQKLHALHTKLKHHLHAGHAYRDRASQLAALQTARTELWEQIALHRRELEARIPPRDQVDTFSTQEQQTAFVMHQAAESPMNADYWNQVAQQSADTERAEEKHAEPHPAGPHDVHEVQHMETHHRHMPEALVPDDESHGSFS